MSAEAIFFYLFAGGAIAGSLGVILNRHPVNAVISLVVSFFFLAGIYILLHAEFMAVIQILVYAGAIMVLFLFVLMLLNLRDDELGEPTTNVTKIASVGAVGVVTWLFASVFVALGVPGSDAASVDPEFGAVRGIGDALLTSWILPFEAAAVLLLVGIVSAVVVAKRRL